MSMHNRVCGVITEDFHEKFMSAYAFAVEWAERTPKNSNLLVHDALRKMTEALAATDVNEQTHLLERARALIGEAECLCLKKGITVVRSQISNMLAALELSGKGKDPKLTTKLQNLDLEVAEARRQERMSAGPPPTMQYRKLRTEFEGLHKEIWDRADIGPVIVRPWMRRITVAVTIVVAVATVSALEHWDVLATLSALTQTKATLNLPAGAGAAR